MYDPFKVHTQMDTNTSKHSSRQILRTECATACQVPSLEKVIIQ